jgi:hypothetical protein
MAAISIRFQVLVAQGHHVGAGIQDLLRLARQDADTRGVFSVDHRKLDAVKFFQTAQVLGQITKPGLRAHVSHGQKIQKHDRPPGYNL